MMVMFVITFMFGTMQVGHVPPLRFHVTPLQSCELELRSATISRGKMHQRIGILYNITDWWGWWFGTFFPYMGNNHHPTSQLTNIFQRGWNHHLGGYPAKSCLLFWWENTVQISRDLQLYSCTEQLSIHVVDSVDGHFTILNFGDMKNHPCFLVKPRWTRWSFF